MSVKYEYEETKFNFENMVNIKTYGKKRRVVFFKPNPEGWIKAP
jgi:hypothetical protein